MIGSHGKSAVAALLFVGALGTIVTATARLGGPLPGPPPLFPQDNWWNFNIAAAPVDTGSAAYISFIGPTKGLHPDFGGDVSTGSTQIYGFPYAAVDTATPLRAVQFQYADESDGVDHA